MCCPVARRKILSWTRPVIVPDTTTGSRNNSGCTTWEIWVRASGCGSEGGGTNPTCRLEPFSCHSCRKATATNLLEQGVELADVQNFLGHADPRTTKLYDQRQLSVTRNIVERIGI
ncbi:MAG: tyrosine-type recombinase/integrase [Planctomycetes bacterium]|nr:tyrosine-type recombinase/integrase [Planctomycetota bacterium]